MPDLTRFIPKPSRDSLIRSRLYARRVRRTAIIVAVAMLGGLAGAAGGSVEEAH